jgi:hypothetical protein
MAQASLKLDREIEQQTGAPEHIAAGLESLARLPPLWPAGAEAWRLTLAHMRDFSEQWDYRARLAGWSDVILYGVHPIGAWREFFSTRRGVAGRAIGTHRAGNRE